jgi:hypothetical protein
LDLARSWKILPRGRTTLGNGWIARVLEDAGESPEDASRLADAVVTNTPGLDRMAIVGRFRPLRKTIANRQTAIRTNETFGFFYLPATERDEEGYITLYEVSTVERATLTRLMSLSDRSRNALRGKAAEFAGHRPQPLDEVMLAARGRRITDIEMGQQGGRKGRQLVRLILDDGEQVPILGKAG